MEDFIKEVKLEDGGDSARVDKTPAVTQGFRANKFQVILHLVLAALIGVSSRFVLLPAALLADGGTKADFLIYFGVAKAVSGEVGGFLADKCGRKHTCLLGWLFGAAIVPTLLVGIQLQSVMFKHTAHMLLGMQQGVTWGLNIICLMDILGRDGRGMASALSNAVGYLGSAFAAPVAAWMVSELGDERWAVATLAAMVALGVAVLALTKDTGPFVLAECDADAAGADGAGDGNGHRNMATGCGSQAQALCSLAGLTVNTATGLVWGSWVLWAQEECGLSVNQVGAVEAWHTVCKVAAMIFAGSIVYCAGPYVMAASALSVLALGLASLASEANAAPDAWWQHVLATGLIGAGVGGAFPALAAAVTAGVPSDRRASVYGAYRMWRDLGYAVGGLSSRLFDWDGFRSTTTVVTIWAAGITGLFWARLVLYPPCRRAADESSSESGLGSESESASSR